MSTGSRAEGLLTAMPPELPVPSVMPLRVSLPPLFAVTLARF
jgi:hypothetical protein